jgi:putative ubiquitin-RnfH superfamily antitoxin RatB of RatAB toxin-antitoxin module
MAETLLNVEVVYATPDQQIKKALQVPVGTSIQQALALAEIPQVNLTELKVGIFSKILPLDHLLEEADRIEIYRPLMQDPKDARRQRASITQPVKARNKRN